MSQSDTAAITRDLSGLDERLKIWKENRLNTINELRDIAEYIDMVTRNVGIAKVMSSCQQSWELRTHSILLMSGCWLGRGRGGRSPQPGWRPPHPLHRRGRPPCPRRGAGTGRGQWPHRGRSRSGQTHSQVGADVAMPARH